MGLNPGLVPNVSQVSRVLPSIIKPPGCSIGYKASSDPPRPTVPPGVEILVGLNFCAVIWLIGFRGNKIGVPIRKPTETTRNLDCSTLSKASRRVANPLTLRTYSTLSGR